MCAKCGLFIDREFPIFTDEQKSNILWTCSSFPIGSFEEIQQQLLKYKSNTDGSFKQMMDLAIKEQGVDNAHSNSNS